KTPCIAVGADVKVSGFTSTNLAASRQFTHQRRTRALRPEANQTVDSLAVFLNHVSQGRQRGSLYHLEAICRPLACFPCRATRLCISEENNERQKVVPLKPTRHPHVNRHVIRARVVMTPSGCNIALLPRWRAFATFSPRRSLVGAT